MHAIMFALWFALALPLGWALQTTTPSPQAAAARALQRQGDFDGAAEAWQAIVAAEPTSAVAWFNLGYSLHAAGRLEEALIAHEQAASFPAFESRASYNLACAHALLGETEAALDALQRAVAAGFEDLSGLRSDPDLDALRGEARFHALLDEIVLPVSRRLRFWIGNWDCYVASNGSLNGRNELAARLDGQVIHEVWSPTGGGPGGESWNFYDPRSRTWRQHWVSSNGQPHDFVGRPHENGILFEETQPDGVAAAPRKRMFIRPIAGGRVQQTGTRSDDGGGTWTQEFDLVYVPRGEPFATGTQPAGAGAGKGARVEPSREFDFLIGDWRMDVEQFGPTGESIRKLTEWSHVRRTNAGATLLDEWEGSGFTIRTWDPTDRVWRLFWTDRQGSAGRFQRWEGTFEDGVGTFLGGSSDRAGSPGSTTVSSKIEFSEITPTTVLWKMWKSPDGGATWVLDYVRRYTRVSP